MSSNFLHDLYIFNITLYSYKHENYIYSLNKLYLLNIDFKKFYN